MTKTLSLILLLTFALFVSGDKSLKYYAQQGDSIDQPSHPNNFDPLDLLERTPTDAPRRMLQDTTDKTDKTDNNDNTDNTDNNNANNNQPRLLADVKLSDSTDTSDGIDEPGTDNTDRTDNDRTDHNNQPRLLVNHLSDSTDTSDGVDEPGTDNTDTDHTDDVRRAAPQVAPAVVQPASPPRLLVNNLSDSTDTSDGIDEPGTDNTDTDHTDDVRRPAPQVSPAVNQPAPQVAPAVVQPASPPRLLVNHLSDSTDTSDGIDEPGTDNTDTDHTDDVRRPAPQVSPAVTQQAPQASQPASPPRLLVGNLSDSSDTSDGIDEPGTDNTDSDSTDGRVAQPRPQVQPVPVQTLPLQVAPTSQAAQAAP